MRWRAPYVVILRHFGIIIFTTAVPMLMPFFGVCFPVLGWKAERVQKHATSYWDARTPARNWRLSQSQLGKIWEEWKKERMKERMNDTHSGFLILEVISRWLHPLTLIKTVTKLSMSVIYWDYINHISAIYVQNVVYISPLSQPYSIKSRPYFSHLNLGMKILTSPPLSKNSFELWSFLYLGLIPSPFRLFTLFGLLLLRHILI